MPSHKLPNWLQNEPQNGPIGHFRLCCALLEQTFPSVGPNYKKHKKRSYVLPKMPSHRLPKWLQNGPPNGQIGHQNGSENEVLNITRQLLPKVTQNGTKMDPKITKMGPKWRQGDPKEPFT